MPQQPRHISLTMMALCPRTCVFMGDPFFDELEEWGREQSGTKPLAAGPESEEDADAGTSQDTGRQGRHRPPRLITVRLESIQDAGCDQTREPDDEKDRREDDEGETHFDPIWSLGE